MVVSSAGEWVEQRAFCLVEMKADQMVGESAVRKAVLTVAWKAGWLDEQLVAE